MTDGEILTLLNETREALGKANALLDRLALGKPAVLGELIEPTLRIKDELDSDLAELERLASKAGL